MNSRQWCRSFQIFIVLCGRLVQANAETGFTPTPTVNGSPTNGEPVSTPTPGPGRPEATDATSVAPTDAPTDAISLDSMTTATAVSEAPTGVTELPAATTFQPVVIPEGNFRPAFECTLL